jgi:hypothetical protein
MNQEIKVLPQSFMSIYIEILFNSITISSGTGFIVLHNNNYFLITNWHNVSGRNPETGKTISADAAIPNKIRAFFNKKNKLGEWIPIDINLYENLECFSNPIWHQHPIFHEKVDVIGIRIPENEAIDFYPYTLPDEVDLEVYPANNLSIVGFPFGKLSSEFFAIWSTGFLATDIDINYNNLPLFLIDCRGRHGQSGSPVISQINGGFFHGRGGVAKIATGHRTTLLGIYSGRLNKESDLGFVWKTSAIKDIIENCI